MGAAKLILALLGAAMLCGFGWELGRCAERWRRTSSMGFIFAQVRMTFIITNFSKKLGIFFL